MRPVSVLIIEDNPVDARCVRESLEQVTGTNFTTAHVETLAQAKESLEKEDFDVLILDLGLPDSQGLETLAHVQDLAPRAPIVVFSGQNDEDLALEAVRRGAQDYLLKDQCNESSLPRAINFAIERLNLLKKIVGLKTPGTNKEELAKCFNQLGGAASLPLTEQPSKKSARIPDLSSLSDREMGRVIQELQIHQIELEMQNEELIRAEQNLTGLSEKYKDLFDFTPVGYLILDEKGVIQEANLTAASLLGFPRKHLLGKRFDVFVLEGFRDTFYLHWKNVVRGEAKEPYEIQLLRRETNFPAHLETVIVQDTQAKPTGMFRTVFWDVTERVEAEKQQEELTVFRALYDLAVSMTSNRHLDETLLMVVQKARNLLGSDTAYIALRDDTTQEVYMHTLSGIKTEAFKNMRVPFGSGLGGKVATLGKGFVVRNYFEEVDPTVHDSVREEGLISGVAAPIQVGGTNLGVLYAFNRRETCFSKSDLDTLSLLGNLAAIEMVKKRQEIDLQNALGNLEQRVQERTAELSQANQRLQEEAVQREQTEAVLRSILSASPVGIGLTEKRIIKWANEAWIKMFGFVHDEEFVGKSAAILYSSSEEYERAGKYLYENLTADKVTATDAVFKRKDGTLFDGHIRVKCFSSPLLGEGAISAISDISDRKQAEKRLQEAEERIRLGLEGGDLGWWEWNPQTDEIFTDERSTDILGYALSDIASMNKSWHDLIHPDDKPHVLRALDKCLRDEIRSFDSEHRVLTKTGEWKWVLVRGKIVQWDAEGKPVRMAGTFLDVNDRKTSDEALRQSEQRFRAIFEVAEDPIFLKDRSLKYAQVNPAFEKLVGIPAPQIIGKRHEELFGNETAEHIKNMESRALAGETVEDEHVKTIRGVPMAFLATRVPVRESPGETVGILTILHDITDRKQRELSRPSVSGKYSSPAMQIALNQAKIVAKTASTVLLTGESGSGKDYLAKYIHDHSDRANGPYFAINCAAIPPELAESELFGHEKGAFTGAVAKKRGLLELAEGGTLLLNEIGDLSVRLQAKLLTFLDTRNFTRVGGEREITVNARLIAATNKNLEKAVVEGTFRNDLLYRLHVVSIPVPPLRERQDDLPILVQELLARIRDEMQIHDMPVLTPAAIDALKRYDWPGNVRELRNVLERALILSHEKHIGPSALGLLDVKIAPHRTKEASFSVSFPTSGSLNETTRQLKRFMVDEALRASGGSRMGAAKLLGISRYSLKHYMKKLGYAGDE